MILKETILSAFTERGTLLKWLKKVEDALNNDVLTDVSVDQISDTQIKLKFTFERGDYIESAVITLPRGEKGEPGKDGRDGQGVAATVEVGTTTTGEAGTPATVVNAGDETNAVLNFTIPRGAKGDKGDKGDTGPQGPQGPQGIQGESGTEVIANPTLAGTEADLTGLSVNGTKYKVPSGGGGASNIIPNVSATPTKMLNNISIDGTTFLLLSLKTVQVTIKNTSTTLDLGVHPEAAIIDGTINPESIVVPKNSTKKFKMNIGASFYLYATSGTMPEFVETSCSGVFKINELMYVVSPYPQNQPVNIEGYAYDADA